MLPLLLLFSSMLQCFSFSVSACMLLFVMYSLRKSANIFNTINIQRACADRLVSTFVPRMANRKINQTSLFNFFLLYHKTFSLCFFVLFCCLHFLLLHGIKRSMVGVHTFEWKGTWDILGLNYIRAVLFQNFNVYLTKTLYYLKYCPSIARTFFHLSGNLSICH